MSDPTRDAFEDSASSLADELQNELDDATRHVKESFNKASETIDDGAEALKDGVRRTRDGVKDAGRRVRSAVNNSTEYFREHGTRGAFRDVEGLVKEHPGKAMLAVAAIGFLLGRSLKMRD